MGALNENGVAAADSDEVELLLAGAAPNPENRLLEGAADVLFVVLACDVPKPANVNGVGDGV